MKQINNVLFYYNTLVFVQYVYFLHPKVSTSVNFFLMLHIHIHNNVDNYNLNFSYKYYFGSFL